jgi:SAM-dependent methyltransferase
MANHEQATEIIDHRVYDEMLTKGRRMIWNDKEWRQGPERAFDVSSQAIQAITKYQPIQDKTYMEVGCGPYSPLGVSAVMYLNGVERSLAFDRVQTNNQRTAEALYDLLAECALNPNRWNISNQPEKVFMDRIKSFDANALKNGNLENGILHTNLNYALGNIEEIPLPDNSVSIVSSRATLEHVKDFEKGMSELYRITRVDGISFHSIDLADHRMYKNPRQYNMWSFLQEDENWSDGLVNRLRLSEILNYAQKAGFDVDILETDRHEIPDDIYNNFHHKYSTMPREELEVTNVLCVFKK